MANTIITVRTDTELKAEAQKVLAELGMDMSTAINVFYAKWCVAKLSHSRLVKRQLIPSNLVVGKGKSNCPKTLASH